MALEGDTQALRMCLERIVPPIKDAPVEAQITGETIADQARSVMSLVSSGEHSIHEILQLMQAVVAMSRVIEVDEIERRLTALEQRTS